MQTKWQILLQLKHKPEWLLLQFACSQPKMTSDTNAREAKRSFTQFLFQPFGRSRGRTSPTRRSPECHLNCLPIPNKISETAFVCVCVFFLIVSINERNGLMEVFLPWTLLMMRRHMKRHLPVRPAYIFDRRPLKIRTVRHAANPFSVKFF